MPDPDRRSLRKQHLQSGTGLLLILSLIYAACFNTAIASSAPVNSASELDYPPFSVVTEDGKADGFSVELMRAALAAMGRDVTFKVAPWAEIKKELEEGEIEALPLVGRSPEREEVYDFTVPYITLYGAVFVRDDEGDIEQLKDLRNHRVGVMLGDNAEEFVRRESISDHIVTTNTFEEAMKKLSSGELDAVVAQRLVGLNLIEQFELDNIKTAIAPLKGFRQDFGFAVTEGNKELLAQLNEGLLVVIADGTYAKLRSKWLGILDKYENQQIFYLQVVSGFLAVFAMLLLGMFTMQHMRNHRSLKVNEERLRMLVQNMPVICEATDNQGNILIWNQEAERATGYPAEEVIGKARVQELLYPEPAYRECVSKQLGGEYRNQETAIVAKDGEERFVAWSNISARHPVPGWSSWEIGIDVTDQKYAMRSLKQTQKYLQTLTNAIPSMLIGIDNGGLVTHMNQLAVQASPLKEEETYGMPILDVLPMLSDHADYIQKTLSEMSSQPTVRFSYFDQSELRYAELGIYPFSIDEVDMAVVRVDDVTERVRVEQIMVQTEKMMSVGGLAAGMAHEINNPLGGILQAIQNVHRRLTPGLKANEDKAKELGIEFEQLQAYLEQRGILGFIDAVGEAGKRASVIVNNMLQFSRKEIKHELIDIKELLETTVALASVDYDMKKNYDFRKINLTQDFQADLPRVKGSRGGIQQVILNLLRNSAQALNQSKTESPQINLKAYVKDGHVKIEVKDNGPGMDEKTAQRIFEPFYTTHPPGEGTGLGLSVSYFIIHEEHGGNINVESTPGNGAKFIITLNR